MKLLLAVALLIASFPRLLPTQAATVFGQIVDDKSHKTLPARMYIQSDAGKWFFPTSVSSNGTAVRYQKQHGKFTNSVEQHTTLSAHPFRVELDPGTYTLTVERGKEYAPLTRHFGVSSEPKQMLLELHRWIDMAGRGWFSGDTHTHRNPADLPNVMLAEDVNVVHPMIYWTTADDVPPSRSTQNFRGDFGAEPFRVDATHVWYPRNTEYEIFTTAKQKHTLGAILAINHKTVFDMPVLPISRVAARAHAEGALLDLEKHNWEWSMAIVPLVKPDLFELANNHLWRAEFGIRDWAVPAPAWMGLGNGLSSEREWAGYGFANYYALLDCGFRLRPAAGTANGVHPVPLGFGRVYVHLDGRFSYEAWMKALDAGRSFVTTGPMLFATVDGKLPGEKFKSKPGAARRVTVSGSVVSEYADNTLEIVSNGEMVQRLKLEAKRNREGAFEVKFQHVLEISGTSWVAVRVWEERPGGRMRFAHTAPFWFEAAGVPLRPRRQEVEWLVQRVKDEITRSAPLLPPEALAEYRQAQAVYEAMLAEAR